MRDIQEQIRDKQDRLQTLDSERKFLLQEIKELQQIELQNQTAKTSVIVFQTVSYVLRS